jgi:hypothetical protein
MDITLTEAAALLGYKSTSTLRRAAEMGELRARRVSPRLWLTTEQDARAWVAGRPAVPEDAPGRGARGRERQSRKNAGAPE